MSQHDYDIADQTAPNVRIDLNLALKALASTSSGATAPTTTYANMLWYDTTSNLLKKRNEANSGWITLGTLDDGASTFTPTLGDNLIDEDSMSSNSAVKVPSQQSVKAYVDTAVGAIHGIGENQTRQNVTASRVEGTTYQNTTGIPIGVNIVSTATTTNRFFDVSDDGVTWLQIYAFGSGVNLTISTISEIVQPGQYYRAYGPFSSWIEMR